MSDRQRDATFRALLRFWRTQRGMSQLDLGLATEVSSRHISFLETGRSQPSVEMVLLLGEALDVPLRSQNELLRAAGYQPAYPEPTVDELLDGQLGGTVAAILDHGDPYPVMVMDRLHRLVRTNRGGRFLLGMAGVDLDADPHPNLLGLLLSAELRDAIANWREVAGHLLRRVQRIALRDAGDQELIDMLADLLATPGLPDDWQVPDLSAPSTPAVSMRIEVGEVQLQLLTTITVFHAPSNVTLEELQIESYLPLDAATRSFFADGVGNRVDGLP